MEKLENIIPNMNFSANDYIEGRCHIFALALHLELGYPIEMMWDDDRLYWSQPNGKGLEHAYCIKENGDLVDIRGIFTKKEIEQEWFCNQRRYEKYTIEQLYKDIDSEFLRPPVENEIHHLRTFIRNNLY